jgi:streptomycin 6-kinase
MMLEAVALQAYNGEGAVRVLEVAGEEHAHLLERCIPGHDLWSMEPSDRQRTAAAVLKRVWRPPPDGASYDTVTEEMSSWRDELPDLARPHYPESWLAEGLALLDDLVNSQPQQLLLHGDFHPANVLAARREPWLAIDPKPLVGDPAYDLALWLANHSDEFEAAADPPAMLIDHIRALSDTLDLDRRRVIGWLYVRALGWDWIPGMATIVRGTEML